MLTSQPSLTKGGGGEYQLPQLPTYEEAEGSTNFLSSQLTRRQRRDVDFIGFSLIEGQEEDISRQLPLTKNNKEVLYVSPIIKGDKKRKYPKLPTLQRVIKNISYQFFGVITIKINQKLPTPTFKIKKR